MRSTNNYINPEDFQRVLDEIPQLKIRKWSDEDVRMLFRLMYWGGLRFDEAIHLEFHDIDIEQGLIHLAKTKTEKNVIAVIPEQFLEKVIPWILEKDDGPLFSGLTYGTAIVWINRLGKKLNLRCWVESQEKTGEKTKSHIFRKSVGKDMLYGTHVKNQKKAPLSVISAKLRHKNLGVTSKYLKTGYQEEQDYWDDDDDDDEK